MVLHMHRTTIMLPRALHERAAARAAARGMSLGELIRKLLEAETTEAAGDDPLFLDARTFAGPADLAASHDDQLYGEEPVPLLKAGERPAAFAAPTRPRRRR